jgi:putative ABC transport system ATP-binding protein
VVLVTHEHDIATFASRIVSFRDGHVVDDQRVERPADARELLKEFDRGAVSGGAGAPVSGEAAAA